MSISTNHISQAVRIQRGNEAGSSGENVQVPAATNVVESVRPRATSQEASLPASQTLQLLRSPVRYRASETRHSTVDPQLAPTPHMTPEQRAAYLQALEQQLLNPTADRAFPGSSSPFGGQMLAPVALPDLAANPWNRNRTITSPRREVLAVNAAATNESASAPLNPAVMPNRPSTPHRDVAHLPVWTWASSNGSNSAPRG